MREQRAMRFVCLTDCKSPPKQWAPLIARYQSITNYVCTAERATTSKAAQRGVRSFVCLFETVFAEKKTHSYLPVKSQYVRPSKTAFGVV